MIAATSRVAISKATENERRFAQRDAAEGGDHVNLRVAYCAGSAPFPSDSGQTRQWSASSHPPGFRVSRNRALRSHNSVHPPSCLLS